MNYFKNDNNEVFAYDDEQIEQGFGADLTSITEEEMKVLTTPVYTQEELNQQEITRLKQFLADTDYKVLPDYDKDSSDIIIERDKARQVIRELEQGSVDGN